MLSSNIIKHVTGLMFGISPFCGPSTLRTLSSAGAHHPLPMSSSSPAVTAQVDPSIDLKNVGKGFIENDWKAASNGK